MRSVMVAGMLLVAVSAGFVQAAETPFPVPKGETVTGRCVGVHDGDSLTVLVEGKRQVKVRLDAIDAPELGQAFSRVSREALSALVFNKECRVESLGPDTFQRTLGRVTVNGRDVNAAMLEAGMAWHYGRFDDRQSMADKQLAAKSAGVGLWADPHPVAPWEWRKMSKAERAAVADPVAAQ